MSNLVLNKKKFEVLLLEMGMNQGSYSKVVRVPSETISWAKSRGVRMSTAIRILNVPNKKLEVMDFFSIND